MADEVGNPKAQRSSKGVHGCAVCGASALFGFANDPRVRYCADHMPGLSDADRAIYRQTSTQRIDKRGMLCRGARRAPGPGRKRALVAAARAAAEHTAPDVRSRCPF